MKTKFSSASDVIHLYAQRSQSHATSGSVYFYDDKIYSYGSHWLMGEFITNDKLETAIVINDNRYSNTTSNHTSQLRSATRQYKQFFVSGTDVRQVLNQIKENVGNLPKARKKEIYINDSTRLFNSLNEFISWRNDKIRPKTEEYKAILALMKVINGGDYVEYLEKESKRIAREKKKAEKIKAQKLATDILKFENHEINRIYDTPEDYVRLSRDGIEVETSQNVSVPRREAKILYERIKAKKDIRGYEIAGYKVISLNGTLTIGCHHININSINILGEIL